MPGSSGGESVVAANPTVVMPWDLARNFRQDRSWLVDVNSYANGEVQRSVLVSTSRKRWVLAFAMTAAAKATMLDFFNDQNGGTTEFYFYDVFETVPKFTYDETGVAITGRYAVRFEGPWQSTFRMGALASELGVGLVEVA